MEYIIEHYFINRTRNIQVFRFFLFFMLKKNRVSKRVLCDSSI